MPPVMPFPMHPGSHEDGDSHSGQPVRAKLPAHARMRHEHSLLFTPLGHTQLWGVHPADVQLSWQCIGPGLLNMATPAVPAAPRTPRQLLTHSRAVLTWRLPPTAFGPCEQLA